MRKTGIPIAAFTLVAGAAGAAMRKHELDTVFDPVTGLTRQGAPISIALIALSVFTAIFLLIFSVRTKKATNLGFSEAFGHGSGALFILVSLLGVTAIACSLLQAAYLFKNGVFLLRNAVWTVLALFAGTGTVLMSNMMKRKGGAKGKWPLATVFPVAFFCTWLISYYMGQISNPVILDYIYEIFAISFSILGYYYAAGFIFGKERPSSMVFCGQMSAFFSVVTLANQHTIYEKGVFLSLSLILLILSTLLIRNANAPRRTSLKTGGSSDDFTDDTPDIGPEIGFDIDDYLSAIADTDNDPGGIDTQYDAGPLPDIDLALLNDDPANPDTATGSDPEIGKKQPPEADLWGDGPGGNL